jgi:hypothetical protein
MQNAAQTQTAGQPGSTPSTTPSKDIEITEAAAAGTGVVAAAFMTSWPAWSGSRRSRP